MADDILESDARLWADNIDTAPDELKPQMVDGLKRYADQQDAAGQSLWPSIDKQKATDFSRVRGYFTQDDHGLAPEQNKELDSAALRSLKPDDTRSQAFNSEFLAHVYNLDPAKVDGPTYTALRRQYTAQQWSVPDMTDSAFFSRQKSEFELETSLGKEAMNASMNNIPAEETFAKWSETNKAHAAFMPGKVAEYREAWNKTFAHMDDEQARMLPVANALWSGLSNAKDEKDMRAVMPLLRNLDESDAGLLMSMLNKRSEDSPDKGLAEQSGQALARSVLDTWSKAGALYNRGNLDSAGVELNRKIPASIIDKGPEAVADFAVGEVESAQGRAMIVSPGGVPSASFAAGHAGTDARLLTDDEKQSAQGELDQRQDDIRTLRRLENIRQEIVDPVKGDNWFTKNIYYPAIQGSGVLVNAMLPGGAGLLVNAAAYADDNYNRLRDAGVAHDKAMMPSLLTGSLQGAFDQVNAGILLNRIPALNSLFKAPVVSMGGALGRFAGRAAVDVGVLTGVQQIKSEVVPPLIDQMTGLGLPTHWLSYTDEEGKQKDGIWLNVAKTYPKAAGSMLLLGLLGAGGATIADVKGSRALLSSVPMLKGYDLSDAQANEVRMLALRNDLDGAKDKFTEYAKPALKAGTSISDAGKKAMIELQDNADRLQRARSTLASYEVNAPNMRRTDNGWQLEFHDGTKSAEFANHADADSARWQHVADIEGFKPVEAVRQIWSEWEKSNLRSGESVTRAFDFVPLTAERAVAEGRVDDSAMQRRKQQDEALVSGQTTPRDFTKAATVIDATTAEHTDAIAGHHVLGMNQVEFSGKVRNIVTKLFAGGGIDNPAIALEEDAESTAKDLLSTGQADWLVKSMREYEGVTGDKLFRTGDDTQLHPDDIVEAFSHMAQAVFLGKTMKGTEAPQFSAMQSKTFRSQLRDLFGLRVGPVISAMAQKYQAAFKRYGAIERASKEGGKLEELAKLIAGSIGLGEQQQHEEGVVGEAGKIAGDLSGKTMSISRADDAAYLDAVKRGDNEAAKGSGLTSEEISWNEAENPVTIYRAGDVNEAGVRPFSSWTEDVETAKRYLDNPGFGGEKLRGIKVDAGKILDITKGGSNDFGELAEALGFDREKGDEWHDNGWRYPWEESSRIKQALEESKYDAVRYRDDFPEGATTIIFTREPKTIDATNRQPPYNAPASQSPLNRDRGGPRISGGREIQEGGKKLEDRERDVQSTWGGVDENGDLVRAPITRDTQGNVIPLSERFNAERPEITHSLALGEIDARVSKIFDPLRRSPELREKLALELQRRASVAVRKWEADRQDSAPKINRDDLELMAGGGARNETERKAAQDRLDKLDSLDARHQLELGGLVQDDAAKETIAAVKQRQKLEAKQLLDDFRSKDMNEASRQGTLNALRTLDAIASGLPSEIRDKIGGMTKLASLKTDEARVKELERKGKVINTEVEKYLQNHFTERLDKLTEKASPVGDAGEKIKGKIGVEGHRLFSQIEGLRAMSKADADTKIDAILQEIDATDSTDTDKLASLSGDLQMTKAFGNFNEKDAGGMAKAVDIAQQIYDTGRSKWLAVEGDRLNTVRTLQRGVIDNSGKTGTIQELKDAEERDKSVAGAMRGFWQRVRSFTQVLQIAFGKESEVAKRWHTADVRASGRFTHENVEVRRKFEDFIKTVFPDASRLERGRQLWALRNERSVVFNKVEGRRTDKVAVPLDKAADVLSGKLGFDAVGLNEGHRDALQAALDAWSASPTKKESVEVERVLHGGTDTETKITPMEAVDALLTFGQKRYADAAEKNGWTKETLDALRDAVPDEAKTIGLWMQQHVENGYDSLNEVHARMYGIDMPREESYWMARFAHDALEVNPDITGETALYEGAMNTGFMRQRKEHSSEIDLSDAVNKFFSHVKATAHFKAYGELAREMNGVLRSSDVQKAMTAAEGDRTFAPVVDWAKDINQGGVKARMEARELDEGARKIAWRQALIGLAWQIATSLKHTLSFFNPVGNMPLFEFAKRIPKLLSGNLEINHIWKSDFIRDRILGEWTPEQQAAYAHGWNTEPSRSSAFLQLGTHILPYIDTVANTGGLAIAYDYAKSQALTSGMNAEQAHNEGMKFAEDTLYRTAYPSSMTQRSLLEIGSGGFAKLFWLFATPGRQKAGLFVTAFHQVMKGEASKSDLARVMFITHVVGGIMAHGIGAAWRAAHDENDPEFFDLNHWQPMDFLIAGMTGPLGELPLVRDLVGWATGKETHSPIEAATRGASSSWKLLKDITDNLSPGEEAAKSKNPVGWYMQKSMDVLTAAGWLMGGTPAAAAVVERLVNDRRKEIERIAN